IVDNHRVRSLWPLDEFLTNNRPVGLYSFAVNYHFSGVDPSHQLRSLCFPLLSVVRSIARGLGMTAGIFAKDSTRSGCVMAQEDSAAENTGSPRPKVVS
ncbi:MAG: hypothetical protein GY904_00860, partial [Planctomycetaceae bacterium]|nr:hypothetical protein [Planctomycetaceae bacterium]